MQTPAEYVVDSAHEGQKPWERSFLEVHPASVWVLAVKAAEDGSGGTIIRLQERAGNATNALVKSSMLGINQAIPLQPWQLKTLFVRRSANGTGEVHEVSLLEV
jgi:alpha-mannosidase